MFDPFVCSRLFARDRHRFWFNIWKTCNRPREGHIYECHKLAKKTYRTACRKAVNDNMNATCTYTKMNLLFSKRDSKNLWNLIRVSKNKQNNFSENYIGIETLFKHYKNKFSNDSSCHDNTYVKEEAEVQEKYKKFNVVRYLYA